MPHSLADELRSIPMSPNLAQSLERAHRIAREQTHRLVTLEHLLLALTEDSEAALILQSANVDLTRLGTDVSGYLGRLPEEVRSSEPIEPRPDGELLRVLQAAASAAQQSRRRQIDGAIVLAAIVGDGKSPAAGLLKAMGMTFEEAIRALQRANTKARLQQPAAKPAPTAAAAAPAKSAQPAPAAVDAQPSAEAAAPGGQHASAMQSADDILAAARARIQQRAAASAKPAPAAPAAPASAAPADEPAAPADAPADGPSRPPAPQTETKRLTAAIEAAMAARTTGAVSAATASASTAPPQQPAPAAAPPPAHPAWTPPPEQPPPRPVRLPQPPLARAPPPPFPARPVPPGDGARRPPLPAGFNRPPRAPWPEPGERTGGGRPPLANGSHAEASPAPPPPGMERARPQPQRTPALGAGKPDKGLLSERIPRRMRVGVPATAEVRIARDRIESLILALSGRGPAGPGAETIVVRALSVRLRAPDGRLWIEPDAPETQWAEGATSLIHDDHAVWRWTVVPRARGRTRVILMVSARTVGRDGIAAESAPPDRAIEVKVRPNYGRVLRRIAGSMVLLALGAVLGRYFEPLWLAATSALAKALGP